VIGLQVGTAPVNWNNSDVPDWRERTTFPRILDEMAAAGYAGTEHDRQFPDDPATLKAELDARGLALCASYQWVRLSQEEATTEDVAAVDPILDLLVALDCETLVVADAMTPARIALAGRVPADGSGGLDDAGWRRLEENLRKVADRAMGRGVRTCYHNHVGSFVESPEECARLVDLLPMTGASLCFDTGHYAYGGGDPTAFVLEHSGLIGHLHLKDVDGDTLATARAEGWSFTDALRKVVFCPFGSGMVDIPAVVHALKMANVDGWVIVEQDTCEGDPTAQAAAHRAYLRETCGI
jgi:inosose dehydratase